MTRNPSNAHSQRLAAGFATAVAFAALPLGATSQPAQPQATADTSWVRAFASPSDNGPTQNTDLLNSDPRFLALVRSSFPQHQWFWREHGRFLSVPDLVGVFLGISSGPGAILDDNRYLTVLGCVPHDCGDRGMIWIDTATEPATLIFTAATAVSGGPETHLWLFLSKHLNSGQMPPDFLSSLKRWIEAHNTDIDSAKDPMLAMFKENIILVTLVQPSGEQDELKYSWLTAATNDTTNSGAKH